MAARNSGTTCGATPESAATDAACPVLFADFGEPLRGDLQYIEAALSSYWGGPAGDDVRGAWERILLNFRDVRADYLRVLGEKVDLIVASGTSARKRHLRPNVTDPGRTPNDHPQDLR